MSIFKAKYLSFYFVLLTCLGCEDWLNESGKEPVNDKREFVTVETKFSARSELITHIQRPQELIQARDLDNLAYVIKGKDISALDVLGISEKVAQDFDIAFKNPVVLREVEAEDLVAGRIQNDVLGYCNCNSNKEDHIIWVLYEPGFFPFQDTIYHELVHSLLESYSAKSGHPRFWKHPKTGVKYDLDALVPGWSNSRQ